MGVFFVKTVMYAKVEGKVGGAVERRRSLRGRLPSQSASLTAPPEGELGGTPGTAFPTGAVALSVSFADSGIKVCLPPASI